MDTQPETTASSFVYHRIPTKVSRKDFNRYIEPHLHRPQKGPKPKLSFYKIFKALVGFQGRGGADVVQPDLCHPLLLEDFIFQWVSK
jgi:hypothetical protein